MKKGKAEEKEENQNEEKSKSSIPKISVGEKTSVDTFSFFQSKAHAFHIPDRIGGN